MIDIKVSWGADESFGTDVEYEYGRCSRVGMSIGEICPSSAGGKFSTIIAGTGWVGCVELLSAFERGISSSSWNSPSLALSTVVGRSEGRVLCDCA